MASMEEGLKPSSCVKIVERVQSREKFHEHRERALHSPETARDQLKEYASLRIKIVKAKGLIGSDVGWHRVWDHQKAVSDPYVNIYMDDVFKKRTKTEKYTTNPTWPVEEFFVEVETGNSVIQLEVMDEDTVSNDDLLGFVEFPVADLPLGQPVRGWLSLTPKENLQGTAPRRLALAMKGQDLDGRAEEGSIPHQNKAGWVFVEMELKIVSGDDSDEYFAFCLPAPTFKMSPVTGFKRKHEPLDAQALCNSLHLLTVSTLDGFLRPLQNAIVYIFTWREKWLSAVLTIVAVAVCIEPLLSPGSFLVVHGLLLLLLRSDARRAAMSADPNNVPLDDEGFRLVAALGSSEKMTVFIERVISCMRGEVQDRQSLRDFAAFTFEGGRPVVDYAELKKQLREVSDLREQHKVDELRQKEARFVSFATKPMAQGTLVATADGKTGEIKECLNPKDKNSEWRYKVAFGDGPTPDVKEVDDDDLHTIANLRWLANKAVLAVIPDGVEDIFMSLQPPIDQAAQIAHKAAETAHDIVAWKTPISWGISIGALLLGSLLNWGVLLGDGILWDLMQWIFKLTLVIIVLFLHVFFADFMVNLRTHLNASAKSKWHASKDPTKWPFFKPATPEDDLPPPAPQGLKEGVKEGVTEGVKEVKEGMKSAAGAVKSAAGGAVKSVAGRAKDAVGAVEHKAGHLVEGIGHGLGFK